MHKTNLSQFGNMSENDSLASKVVTTKISYLNPLIKRLEMGVKPSTIHRCLPSTTN